MAQRARDATAGPALRLGRVPTPKTPSPGRATSSSNASRRTNRPATACAAPSPARASCTRSRGRARRPKEPNIPTISTPRRRCAASRRTGFWPCAAGADEGVLKITIDIDATAASRGAFAASSSVPARRRARDGGRSRDSFKRLMRPSIETEQLAAAKGKRPTTKPSGSSPRTCGNSFPAAGTEGRDRPRPWFRTGVQGRGARFAGAACFTTHDRLSPCAAEPLCRGRRNPETLAAKYKNRGVRRRGRTAGRETEQLVPRTGAYRRRDLRGERGWRVGLARHRPRPAGSFRPRRDGARAEHRGRRVRPPFRKLVKIDPKSIGVGQYQHSVDQGN